MAEHGPAKLRFRFPGGRYINTRELNKALGELLSVATGTNIESSVDTCGSIKWYWWEADFANDTLARDAAQLAFKEVCSHLTDKAFIAELITDDNYFKAFVDDECLVLHPEWKMIMSIKGYHDIYVSKGGKMGVLEFVNEALGQKGGIDRVYVEEGLDSPWN